MSRMAIYSPDFKAEPFWWDGRDASIAESAGPWPAKADVVIIGAGVTGVEAARVLAENGRHVVVIDAGNPGEGASSRNAGQIGRNFKHPYSELKSSYGIEVARSFFRELQQAYDHVKNAGEHDPAAFGWRECGRVIGAMTPHAFDLLCGKYELRAGEIGEHVEILSLRDMHHEMGSGLYRGGIRLPFNGSIQPARYHRYLMNAALRAGAQICANTPVTSICRQGDDFIVKGAMGDIRCRQVMVATNGYSGPAIPWIQKRLLPITSYMIATEELSDDAMARVLPSLRTYHDNRRRSHFFTVPPGGNRILMGGRTGSLYRHLPSILAELHGDLTHIFPQLEGVRLSHGWEGRCSAPRDLFPRFGEDRGMFYALGYSFSGMAMGPYLARKTAALMLGDKVGAESLFARPSFPVIPRLARGPWTVAAITGWYGWADRPSGMGRRM